MPEQNRDGSDEPQVESLWPQVDDDDAAEPPEQAEPAPTTEPEQPAERPEWNASPTGAPGDRTSVPRPVWGAEPTGPPGDRTSPVPAPPVDRGSPPGDRTSEVRMPPQERIRTPMSPFDGPTRQLPVPPPAQPQPPGDDSFTGVIEIPAELRAAWQVEPPRPGPMRIEPAPAAPPRIRRIALLVSAALIVVAAAGAGVVFGVPGLAKKLGLRGSEADVAIQPPAPPVQFAPKLRPSGGEGAAPTASGVRDALAGPASVPALGTLTGAVLDPTTGAVLWEQDADTALVPASTGKILTAAAALLTLDHTEQLSTKVMSGTQPGEVVIVGGGDPTLSALKAGTESVYPGAAHLDDLVAKVKAAAGEVRTVRVDLGRYAGPGMEPSWDPRDIAGGYIAPIVPGMLDGGRADATKENSARSPNPARALADEFARRIGATVAANAEAGSPQGAELLGEVRSAPVVELVDTMLQRSDNVLSEAIAREVARAAGEEPSFAGASRATLKVLRENGFDITGVSLVDASGLSGQDKVPARLLAAILSVAAGPDGKDQRTAKLRPLLGGLPVAGGSGTLADRYQTPAAAPGKGWVRAKTGTLTAPPVNSLAGVVLDADGRLLVFALMTNGTQSNTARPALDVVAATLRQCGCR